MSDIETRCTARIDLDALRHNLQRVRAFAPQSRVMAVIKANAYGHGAVEVAGALGDADAFAVASIAEAVALRRAGVSVPVTVLGGPLSAADVSNAAAHRLDLVVHEPAQMDWLQGFAGGIWLKLDTGMHRLGFPVSAVAELQQWLASPDSPDLLGWMTHLACADEQDHPLTGEQLSAFSNALQGVPGTRSIANSAGVCGWPKSHADWVRPGIMLYGASPLQSQTAATLGLRPVMTLMSRLLSVRQLPRGAAVGYGASWRCPEDMPVGIAAIGYADGYPRHLPSGTPVAVAGRPCALAGRVSMDMIAIDLRQHPDARVGDDVQLWGEQIPVDEIAHAAGTIAYELFCGIGPRVRFDYV